MDPRDMDRQNGVSLSIEPLVYVSPMATNWGVSTVPGDVTFDPQVHSPRVPEAAPGPGWDLMTRGARRRLLAGLSDEFATMYDDLLRDLAR
jgi:hypothetical protein